MSRNKKKAKIMEYPLIITEFGQFTCHATSNEDFGDGIDIHRCPSFDTIQEVADWISENATD